MSDLSHLKVHKSLYSRILLELVLKDYKFNSMEEQFYQLINDVHSKEIKKQQEYLLVHFQEL